MSLLPKRKAPPAAEAPTAESGVQLSRHALYERRMNEIYDDVEAGRCGFDEAVERVVEAIVSRTTDWFLPRGHEELAKRVRAACANDPRMRKALGR